MPEIVTDQLSPKWHEARVGRITASVAAGCLGLSPHMGPITAWKAIMGIRQAENGFMRYGTANESAAKSAYQIATGHLVRETGFWVHPTLDWLGASPDAFVGHRGCLEVKAPQTLPDSIPPHHAVQMQVQMFVCDCDWAEYWAWHPEQGHYLARINADIGNLVELLKQFYETYVITNTPPPRRKRKAKSVDDEIFTFQE